MYHLARAFTGWVQRALSGFAKLTQSQAQLPDGITISRASLPT